MLAFTVINISNLIHIRDYLCGEHMFVIFVSKIIGGSCVQLSINYFICKNLLTFSTLGDLVRVCVYVCVCVRMRVRMRMR